MYRLLKRKLRVNVGITSLTIVSVMLVGFCSTPWAADLFGTEMLLGIPIAFIAATLLLPIISFLILWLAMRTAEDIDRHDPRYENE